MSVESYVPTSILFIEYYIIKIGLQHRPYTRTMSMVNNY